MTRSLEVRWKLEMEGECARRFRPWLQGDYFRKCCG